MAIDSQDKRRSTLGRLPVADSDIDNPDRRQVWKHYSGINTDALPDVTPVSATLSSPQATATVSGPQSAATVSSPKPAVTIQPL